MTFQTCTYSLLVEFHEEDGGYLSSFPALPGCHSWGSTYQEAVLNAEEALLGFIEALQENGEPIPIEPYPADDVTLGVMVKVPEPA